MSLVDLCADLDPTAQYDFTPQHIWVQQGEWVHFSWTGSNTNPNNNAGQGTQGTDRSNMIMLRNMPPQYDNIAQLSGPPMVSHSGRSRLPTWLTCCSPSRRATLVR
mgnify:CR=1 FL=1